MSSGVGKVGASLAGGVITATGVPTVLVEGMPCSVEGDRPVPHGDPPHASAIFPPGSGNPTVLVGGRPVLRDLKSIATCGHPLTNGAGSVRTS